MERWTNTALSTRLGGRSSTRRLERGASLTEFAIVAPLFVAIIYASLYLCDLGVFKLKAQEIARYGAWGFTERPLSNYGDDQFSHSSSYAEARDQIIDELNDVYVDLDGAHENILPGRWAQTMSAVYLPGTTSDFKNREVEVVPDWANFPFAEDLSALWWILQLLQIGGDVNDFIIGPVKRMKLNEKGQVTAEAAVSVLPPVRPQYARQAIEMARVARDRGADLSRWAPNGSIIRDRAGRDIQTTLIADSWKIHQGWSTYPGGTFAAGYERQETQYANIVKEVSDRGISALPLGSILQFILSFQERFPDELNSIIASVTGFVPNMADKQVFSRPYSEGRPSRPNEAQGGEPARGQVEIFSDMHGESHEDAPVRRFESGAMYYDPDNPSDSDYADALNRRGPYFMGCSSAETRGCWDTQ